MSPIRAQRPRISECTDDLGQNAIVDKAPGPTLAPLPVIHSSCGDLPGHRPPTRHETLLNMDLSSISSFEGTQRRDGGTWQLRPDAQLAVERASQQRKGSHPVTYNAAVGLINRPDGGQLATTILEHLEHGSTSIPRSYDSINNLGHYPRIRSVEESLPECSYHRPASSSDNVVLGRSKEKVQEECIVRSGHPVHGEGTPASNSNSGHRKVTAAPSDPPGDRQITPRLTGSTTSTGRTSSRDILRGLMARIRSHRRSRSCWTSRIETSPPARQPHISIRIEDGDSALDAINPQEQFPCASEPAMASLPTQSMPHHPPTYQMMHAPSLKGKAEPSSQGSTYKSPDSPSNSPTNTAPAGTLIPELDPSHSQDLRRLSPSMRSISSPPRGVVGDYVSHANTPVLDRKEDGFATLCRSESAVAYRNDKTLLGNTECNASLNASFCSAVSTSYSGTVLGIDLDVQYYPSHALQRSVSPVWFIPNKVEPTRGRSHPRSVTSSALISLLPIAVDEGLMRRRVTAPQLTMHSPSSTMIKAHDAPYISTPASSPHSRPPLHSLGTVSSYQNIQGSSAAQYALCTAAGMSPARPTTLTKITALQRRAPLAGHRRHDHSYCRADKSRTRLAFKTSFEAEEMLTSQVVRSDSLVRKCGGMVRSTSRAPTRGLPQRPQKQPGAGESRSCSRTCSREKNDLTTHESVPAQKVSSYTSMRSSSSGDRTKGKMLKTRRPTVENNVREQGIFVPPVGHALRKCFCQPYDGVDRQAGGGVTTQAQKGWGGSIDRSSLSRETTPNARIVIGNNPKDKIGTGRNSVVDPPKAYF